MAVTYALIYYLCFYKKMGIDGWFLANFIRMIIELVTFSIMCFVSIHPETRGWISWQELTDGFPSFFMSTIWFVLGNYPYQVGAEVATFFIGTTKDPSQIGAHSVLLNISTIVYDFSLGYALVGWTKFNRLLGQNRPQAAKRFSLAFFFGMLATSLVVSLVVYLTMPWLVYIYSRNSPGVEVWLRKLITLYAFLCVGDFCFSFMIRISRSVGWIKYTTLITVVLFFGLQTAIDFFLVYRFAASCVYIDLNFFLLECLSLLIPSLYVIAVDWDKAEMEQDSFFESGKPTYHFELQNQESRLDVVTERVKEADNSLSKSLRKLRPEVSKITVNVATPY